MALKSIRAAIVSAVSGVDGTGDYVHDLAGTGQVQSGKHERPPGPLPFVAVETLEVVEQEGPPLTDLHQVGTWLVTGWTAGSPKHPGSRMDAAEDLADDIRRALREDRTLGGLVIACTCSISPFAPETKAVGQASYGVVIGTVSAYWRER